MSSAQLMHYVEMFGYIGIFLAVLLQSGLVIGLFFPGDSLLFTAGFLSIEGYFNIWWLTLGVTIMAIVGYEAGYWIGKKLEHWLLKKERFWLKQKYIRQAHDFYEKHGGQAIIIGRLLPVIRTFVPIVAGMVEMPRKTFWIWNVVGGVVWAGGITLAGYFLGRIFPAAQHYLMPVTILIIVLSAIPGVVHWWKGRH